MSRRTIQVTVDSRAASHQGIRLQAIQRLHPGGHAYYHAKMDIYNIRTADQHYVVSLDFSRTTVYVHKLLTLYEMHRMPIHSGHMVYIGVLVSRVLQELKFGGMYHGVVLVT